MLQQHMKKKAKKGAENRNDGSNIPVSRTNTANSPTDVNIQPAPSVEVAAFTDNLDTVKMASESNVDVASGMINDDSTQPATVRPALYKTDPNDEGLTSKDTATEIDNNTDLKEQQTKDAQQALLIRRRAMNTIHSRRKRERQRIEIEVLKEQCAEYSKKNLLIQQENKQYESIIANAKATIEQRERFGAVNAALFQQHQLQFIPQQQQQQQQQFPLLQQAMFNAAPTFTMPLYQQQNSALSLLQLLQQQQRTNQSLQGSTNSMYLPQSQLQPVYNVGNINPQTMQLQSAPTSSNIIQNEQQYTDQIHQSIRQQIATLQQRQHPNAATIGTASMGNTSSNSATAATIQNIVQQLAMNASSVSGSNSSGTTPFSVQSQPLLMPQSTSVLPQQQDQQQQLLLAQQWYLQQQIQLQQPNLPQYQDQSNNVKSESPPNKPSEEG